MIRVLEEYKEIFKSFLKDKIYITFIIIISILSYGFTITNHSVGVDDLVQERYVTGTYLLSQGRWGNVLLSGIFNTTNYVPFWADLIATILFVLTTIVLCSFIKKEIGNMVNKRIYYIIFSGIVLSYPIVSNIYIYHFANVATAVSNIAMIIILIIIYENTYNVCDEKIGCLVCLILPLFISTYEASCQLYITFLFIMLFINLIKNKELDSKAKMFFFRSVLYLIIGIYLNSMIVFSIKSILFYIGKLTPDFSTRTTYWFSENPFTCLQLLQKNVINQFKIDILNVPYITLFFALLLFVLVLSIIQSIKSKNIFYMVVSLCFILSNFAINVIQTRVIYRTSTSWSISIAFMILLMIMYCRKNKTIHKITLLVSCLIILYNSRELTALFYNDYLRYDREKHIAYNIADTIIRTCDDPTKPLIYVFYDKGNIQGNGINLDNGWSVLRWGALAFEERGTETTRFINSLGYNFNTVNNEEYEEGYNEFKNANENYKNDFVIELDKYIIVKLVYEPRIIK